MDIVSILIQLVSGAVGGNLAGTAKKIDLGTVGNSVIGLIGGIVVGQVLPLLGIGDGAAAGNLDITSILTTVLGSGVGGGALTAIVGLIKDATAKK